MNIAIINSSNFWSMGWATTPESQQHVVESLKRAKVNVLVFEVCSKAQLVNVLEKLDKDNYLIWPNAYELYQTQEQNETLWLAEIIEEHGFSLIGNNSEALRNVLLKNTCQKILEEHQVSIPLFASITHDMLEELEYIIDARGLVFPLFTKPNALSTSKGITQDCVVNNIKELQHQIVTLGDEHGYPVMVEEFLPEQDITVAVFMTPDKPIFLATYYDTEIYDSPGAVLDYDIRQLDWNDRKGLRIVNEPDVLNQIEKVAVDACKALNIDEFTRIDCRLDRNGKLKVFDVNGLPGLELPFSTTVWQMIVRMENDTDIYAFDSLISLIVYCAASRHNISAPERISMLAKQYIEQFTLNSESIPA